MVSVFTLNPRMLTGNTGIVPHENEYDTLNMLCNLDTAVCVNMCGTVMETTDVKGRQSFGCWVLEIHSLTFQEMVPGHVGAGKTISHKAKLNEVKGNRKLMTLNTGTLEKSSTQTELK